MGLTVAVGTLSQGLAAGDEPGVRALRNDFARLNAALRKNKLEHHREPEEVLDIPYRGHLEEFPYSCLHYLRRIAAHSRAGIPATPSPTNRPAKDPVLQRAAAERKNASHLIVHSDSEGFYLPIDFPAPLWSGWFSRIPGDIVGSSQQLLAELVQLSTVIGIALVDAELPNAAAAELATEGDAQSDFSTERAVWFTLFEAATASVRFKTAIRYC